MANIRHLKLIKGLSYRYGSLKASNGAPDVYVDDETAAHLLGTGRFTEVGFVTATETPKEDRSIPAPQKITLDQREDLYQEVDKLMTTEEKLKEMTLAELRAYAKVNGIDLDGATKKADVLQLLIETDRKVREAHKALMGE